MDKYVYQNRHLPTVFLVLAVYRYSLLTFFLILIGGSNLPSDSWDSGSARVLAFLLPQQTAVQSPILFLSGTVDKIWQNCSVVKDSASAATAGNCCNILLEEQEWWTCQQSSGESIKTCPRAQVFTDPPSLCWKVHHMPKGQKKGRLIA